MRDFIPHPVDQHVGARLRLARKMRGLPQRVLAAPLGLTFQQIQKYERGANRISASMLYALARQLSVPIDWFFEGVGSEGAMQERLGERARSLRDFMATREGPELAVLMARLPAAQRAQVLALMRAFAEPEALGRAS
ncbi:helix-turn-helix domain-containing protein [Caulobacter hibisci]|uniref:helix-turn-helix domain-containing protein n=1 Tax=Caulobacter hibisci TaxID=2035993 RepID=UPI001E3B31C4|nr:helix-turn-helix transcriptional regulator [Caulobacter hibisci]